MPFLVEVLLVHISANCFGISIGKTGLAKWWRLCLIVEIWTLDRRLPPLIFYSSGHEIGCGGASGGRSPQEFIHIFLIFPNYSLTLLCFSEI